MPLLIKLLVQFAGKGDGSLEIDRLFSIDAPQRHIKRCAGYLVAALYSFIFPPCFFILSGLLRSVKKIFY